MTRIESVDVMRVAAILAVIAIHVGPYRTVAAGGLGPFDLWLVINQLARFAVPFFFVMSGFFWGQKIHKQGDVAAVSIAMCRRILTIFVAWSVIYFAVDLAVQVAGALQQQDATAAAPGFLRVVYWQLVSHPIRLTDLVFEGTREHLWFLAALPWCVAISAVLVARGLDKWLLAGAAALYVFGVLAKAYALTPAGIALAFNTRNGPFFGLLLFTTGYLLSKRRPLPANLGVGLAVLASGTALHFAEVGFLQRHQGADLAQDYVFGTYLMGVGAALMALSNRIPFRPAWVTAVGPRVLGVYASHHLLVQALRPLAAQASTSLWNLAWQAALVPLVFCLSLAATSVLARWSLTRGLVE